MPNLTSTIRGNYPLNTFETIRDLWQKTVATVLHEQGFAVENDVRSITNAVLNCESAKIGVESDVASLLPNLPQFLLLQSPKFQALLTGQIIDSDRTRMTIEATFVPTKIDEFIELLIPCLPATVKLIADPNFTNDSDLQGHFTQLLLNALIEANSDESDREIVLQQQVAQANLLNYIITQIYQTLDLPVILQAAVDRVQTFLHADRLIVYQFDFTKIDGKVSNRDFDDYTGVGRVAYESLGNEQLQSVLDVTERQDCFEDRRIWHEYRNGMTKEIDRVDLEYAQNQCMLDLMARSQIKSKLVVPIVVKTELWGLLIAHQCKSARHWQTRESQFLQQVAEHLALAIDRSELYTNSLWHTQELEHRVNERTRELRDAVIVAQTANQSKTEFLALLSHELRTPLTSILGLSATLLRLPLLSLTERQQKYLQVIHNSGEHLSELIDDILDFYKLEVGKLAFSMTNPRVISSIILLI